MSAGRQQCRTHCGCGLCGVRLPPPAQRSAQQESCLLHWYATAHLFSVLLHLSLFSRQDKGWDEAGRYRPGKARLWALSEWKTWWCYLYCLMLMPFNFKEVLIFLNPWISTELYVLEFIIHALLQSNKGRLLAGWWRLMFCRKSKIII